MSADIALTATAGSITKAYRKKIELAKGRLTRNIKTKGSLAFFVCILKISDLDLTHLTFTLNSFRDEYPYLRLLSLCYSRNSSP